MPKSNDMKNYAEKRSKESTAKGMGEAMPSVPVKKSKSQYSTTKSKTGDGIKYDFKTGLICEQTNAYREVFYIESTFFK